MLIFGNESDIISKSKYFSLTIKLLIVNKNKHLTFYATRVGCFCIFTLNFVVQDAIIVAAFENRRSTESSLAETDSVLLLYLMTFPDRTG